MNCTDFRSQLVKFKILVLVLKSKLDVAPKYLMDHIHSTLSATSHQPIRSSYWHVLFVPRVRTAMAQTRSFATIGPSLWNALPSSIPVVTNPWLARRMRLSKSSVAALQSFPNNNIFIDKYNIALLKWYE